MCKGVRPGRSGYCGVVPIFETTGARATSAIGVPSSRRMAVSLNSFVNFLRDKVTPNVLHRWRREFHQGPGNAFPGNGKQRWSEGRIAELERKVGQQTLEIDFLRRVLQRVEEARMLQGIHGAAPATSKSTGKSSGRRR